MTLTKQVKILKVEVHRLYDAYPSILIFEKVTFDDPSDDILPQTAHLTRELMPNTRSGSPEFPDVSGEEQIVRGIASVIWP